MRLVACCNVTHTRGRLRRFGRTPHTSIFGSSKRSASQATPLPPPNVRHVPSPPLPLPRVSHTEPVADLSRVRVRGSGGLRCYRGGATCTAEDRDVATSNEGRRKVSGTGYPLRPESFFPLARWEDERETWRV